MKATNPQCRYLQLQRNISNFRKAINEFNLNAKSGTEKAQSLQIDNEHLNS